MGKGVRLQCISSLLLLFKKFSQKPKQGRREHHLVNKLK